MALRSRARSTRLLVVTLVGVSLVTITVDYREGSQGPLGAAGDAALEAIAPLQAAVSKVTHPVGSFFSTLLRLPAIRRENERLKSALAEAEQELSRTSADMSRVAEMEALLGLRDTLGAKVQTTAAQVIANGVSNFEWTITLDKGSDEGIAVDMPVLAPAGLVGHVVRVSADASVVELIIDPDSAVAGRLATSGKTGLVEGQGARDLRMSLVDTTVDIQPAESVVTAGYRIPGVATSLYPPNIAIGEVSHTLTDPSALEKAVTVRPAVDFSTLDLVLVVLSHARG
jgi:rod shape-determining protein MreC